MKCKDHGIEYEWPGSCPACRADRRQDEMLALQDKQYGEERRQSQILEQMAWEQQAQQTAIDDLASSERALIEEERQRRRIEEGRAFLRAGLPEFPEPFQVHWRDLNKRLQAVEEEEERLEQEISASERRLRQRKERLTGLVKTVHDRITAGFERSLRETSCPFADLGWSRLSSLPGFASAAREYQTLIGSPWLAQRRGTLPAALPEWTAGVVLVLESLQHLAEIKLDKRIGAGLYVAFWFASYLALAIGLGLLFLPAPQELAGLAYPLAVVLAVPAAMVLGQMEKQRRERQVVGSKDFLAQGSAFLAALSEAIGRTGDGPGRRPADGVEPEEILSLARAFGNELGFLRRKLLEELHGEHYLATFPRQPEQAEIRQLTLEIEDAERSLADLRKQAAASEPSHSHVRRCHALTRDEIARIGREIVEGIRVAGKPVAVEQCPSCSNWNLAEEAGPCLFCA